VPRQQRGLHDRAGRRRGPAAPDHVVARPGAHRLREPRSHRPPGLELDDRRQLLPPARHLGHLGGGERLAGAGALDRERRAPRSHPLCLGGAGSWEAGLDVERRFLVDSVRIDSTAFALEDGSGLAAGNLVTPRAFVQLLGYMRRHPQRGPFLAALPRPGQPGTLLKRLVGTPFESRVLAKTGSIDRVNSLSGYIEQPNGRTITFSVQANARAVPSSPMFSHIASAIVRIG